MKSYKILVTESKNLSNETKKLIKKIGKTDFLDINQDKLQKIINYYDIIIIGLSIKINSQIIKKTANLKYILSPTTGLNHLDIEELKKRQVRIFCLKNEKKFLKDIPATAEHTFALMLNLYRKINLASRDVIRGNWKRKNFIGSELLNKKIGIVGYGRIGRIIKRYALAFGMKVYYYDPYINIISKNIIKINKLEKLASLSNIFTIHAPSNKDNKNLISKEILKNLKKDSILINTSRGDLIDEKHLIYLLEKKKISGAALDVIKEEYNKTINKKLVNYAKENNNLIITPHIGGYTYESINKTYQYVVNKLLKHIDQT